MARDSFHWDSRFGYQRYSHIPSSQDGRLMWIGRDQAAQVAGYDLTGALVYIRIGKPTKEPHSEPSLIDPDLHVGFSLEQGVPPLGFTASYAALSGLGRAEYLAWLAGGRTDPHVPREFIRIFLCGIERRLLIDIARDPGLHGEIAAIREAVFDLTVTYQRLMYPGFTDELAGILDILELDPVAFVQDPPPPPDIDLMPWTPPDVLPLGLGCFTSQRTPIPAEWAFAWAWYRPEVPTRTPMHRAPHEYRALFTMLYRQQFKQGIVLRQGKKTLKITATVTNQSIGYVTLDLSHIPDVFARQKPIEDLRLLAIRASTKLDGYSRWIQKNPDDADTLAAIAQYPPELVSQELPAAQEFFLWITGHMGDRPYVEFTGADLFEVWSVTAPRRERLTPREAQALGYVFGWFGFGIEPDVRLGKPALHASTPVIVFRRESVEGERRYAPIPTMNSEAFQVAALATHLALALIAVEQVVTPDVLPLVIAELDDLFEMDALEKARLHAYLLLQIEKPLKVTGHKSRIVALSEHQREIVGAFVISVASRHGSISPQIVKLVGQVYAQLGLDRTRVSSDLHAAMTSSAPSRARHAGGSKVRTEVQLDHGIIARKVREASEVSALLGDVFTDDLDLPALPPVSAIDPTSAAGLDPSHSALLRALAGPASRSFDEFARLATTYHLLAAGAIDTLNEAALDLTDSPLIEGGESLAIDQDILQELLS
jgi:hypothetical protein